MIAPGTEVKPPRISTGSAFSATSEMRELHAELAAPHDAGDQRHHARDRPDDDPDLVQRNADRLRRLVVVGHGAQRAADARLLEEQRQRADQRGRDDAAATDRRLVHQDAAVEDVVQDEHRLLRDAEIERIDVAAPDSLAEAIEEEGDADRGHEQR